ncbi:MAG: SMC-Scp complex subunit ScpB [Rhodospirillales bacterium]
MSEGDMRDGDAQNLRLLEAILFASAEALPERVLAQRLPEGTDLAALLEDLKRRYANRGVNLVRAGKTWAFRTAPDLASRLVVETRVPRKLSRAAVETLAIIAYHQPVTRAEIEEIRGVSVHRGTLDVLLEAGWIRLAGRRRTPGRPMNWATTDVFLDHFGLEKLSDLPGLEELKAAGLLDSGPAIQASRVLRAVHGPGPGEGETAEQEQAAPADAEDGPPEPLEPDGGR